MRWTRPVALHPPQGLGQHLLADPPDQLADAGEPQLAVVGEDLQDEHRPLVGDGSDQVADQCVHRRVAVRPGLRPSRRTQGLRRGGLGKVDPGGARFRGLLAHVGSLDGLREVSRNISGAFLRRRRGSVDGVTFDVSKREVVHEHPRQHHPRHRRRFRHRRGARAPIARPRQPRHRHGASRGRPGEGRSTAASAWPR